MLRGISWQLGGGKGAKPKPVSPLAERGRKRFGITDLPFEEVEKMLARMRPAPKQAADVEEADTADEQH